MIPSISSSNNNNSSSNSSSISRRKISIISGGAIGSAAVAVVVAFLMLSTAAAAAAAAATTAERPSVEAPSSISGTDRSAKRNLGLMDCGERCESFEIKIFKAYWRNNYPDMHFIDFLRDMVVYSAHFPEFKHFKPLIDQAVQTYELCRYVTCSTDYMG